MSTISEFTSRFQTQISKSKYPKIYYSNFLGTLDRQRHLNKVLQNLVTCTGVLTTKEPLFKDTDSVNYYEFLLAYNQNVDTWNYFYVDVKDFELIKDLIPFVHKIDFLKGTSTKSYLSSNTFSKSNLKNYYVEVPVYVDNYHPILKSFTFTGKIYILNKDLVYEYYNNNETFDSAVVNYYSKYEPLNNRASLNIGTKPSIYEAQENIVTEEIILKDKIRRLDFTGRMNNTFIKDIVLYKYIETIENQRFIVFKPQRPFYGSKNLMYSVLGSKPALKLSSVENQQRLKTKQTSTILININKK